MSSPTAENKQSRRGRWLTRGKVGGVSGIADSKESLSCDTCPVMSQDESSGQESSNGRVNGYNSWESPLLDAMPTTAMPDIPKPAIRQRTSSYGGLSPNQRPTTSPIRRQKQAVIIDDGFHYTEDFENMVIECNTSDSSLGDITCDESLDEEYYHNRQANQRYVRSTNVARSCEKRGYSKSRNNESRSPSSKVKNPILSPRKLLEDHKYDNNRDTMDSNSLSNCEDLDEQEQALIELAMERSLIDCGSVASSKVSRATYRSQTSNAGSLNSKDNNLLAGSGCHLAMISNRTNSRSASPGDSGARFLWKRDGKKWLKIPVTGTDECNLHAIAEEKDPDYMEPMSIERNFGSNRISPASSNSSKFAHLPTDQLERMEQVMLEEALHRSVDCLHFSGNISTSSTSMHIQSPTFHSPSRSVSRNPSFEKSNMLPTLIPAQREGNNLISDADFTESVREREMIELVLERSMHEQSFHSLSSNTSYESSRSSPSFAQSRGSCQGNSRPPRPNMPRPSSKARPSSRQDESIPGAGGHLAFVCARKPSTRAILNGIDYEEDEEELMAEHLQPTRSCTRRQSMQSSCSYSQERNVGDCAGQTNSGVKLVWKRGPNNTCKYANILFSF